MAVYSLYYMVILQKVEVYELTFFSSWTEKKHSEYFTAFSGTENGTSSLGSMSTTKEENDITLSRHYNNNGRISFNMQTWQKLIFYMTTAESIIVLAHI